MIYHLPFRDWLELDTKVPAADDRRGESDPENGGSGDRR